MTLLGVRHNTWTHVLLVLESAPLRVEPRPVPTIPGIPVWSIFFWLNFIFPSVIKYRYGFFLFYWDCILIAWIQYFSKSDMEPVLFTSANHIFQLLSSSSFGFVNHFNTYSVLALEKQSFLLLLIVCCTHHILFETIVPTTGKSSVLNYLNANFAPAKYTYAIYASTTQQAWINLALIHHIFLYMIFVQLWIFILICTQFACNLYSLIHFTLLNLSVLLLIPLNALPLSFVLVFVLNHENNTMEETFKESFYQYWTMRSTPQCMRSRDQIELWQLCLS